MTPSLNYSKNNYTLSFTLFVQNNQNYYLLNLGLLKSESYIQGCHGAVVSWLAGHKVLLLILAGGLLSIQVQAKFWVSMILSLKIIVMRRPFFRA